MTTSAELETRRGERSILWHGYISRLSAAIFLKSLLGCTRLPNGLRRNSHPSMF